MSSVTVLLSLAFSSEIKDKTIQVINDFYSTVIFYEYVKNNNFLNNILKKESANIYQDIILNNNDINNYLNLETIKNNIKYDFSRKIVLENILENYKEYIFSNPNDINFIYNYKIKYITIPIENLISDKKFQKIIDSQNFYQQ